MSILSRIGPGTPGPEPLSTQDQARLSVWKWRYMLTGQGWSREEANRLIWARWLASRGLLQETTP